MALDIVNYRPSWQKLRVSTLAVNNPYGGITTESGATDALERFSNYVEDANPSKPLKTDSYTYIENTAMKLTPYEEYACRIFRVTNFLGASINGLKALPQYAPIVGALQEWYDDYILKADNHSVQTAAEKWNWEPIEYELEKLWRVERFWFTAIDIDMKERVKEKGKSAQEMMIFISIMERINRI